MYAMRNFINMFKKKGKPKHKVEEIIIERVSNGWVVSIEKITPENPYGERTKEVYKTFEMVLEVLSKLI